MPYNIPATFRVMVVEANKLNRKLYENVHEILKTAPFCLIKKSEVPVVVVEMGYLSNKDDRAYLTSSEGQDKIAGNIAGFIKDMK